VQQHPQVGPVPTGEGKRKANSGRFKKGYEPRRHDLTRAEKRRGLANVLKRVIAGTPPSRASSSIRSKIRLFRRLAL
jgi:hypothetical protein